MLFVHITEGCTNDAKVHGLVDDVQRFRDRVESTQSLFLFDPFPPPYLVKKKLGGRQGRLIAEKRSVGEHVLIVFLGILIRGDHQYEEGFAKDPRGYGEQHFRGRFSAEQAQTIVVARTAGAQLAARPDPSSPEYGFLYGAFAHQSASRSDTVCETAEWVARVTRAPLARQLNHLAQPCLDALSKEPGLHYIESISKPGWGIWAWRDKQRVLLITPSTDATAVEPERLARQTEASLVNADAMAISRASRRAYPAIVLADEDLWLELEQEPIATMALSPEESDVLDSARGTENPFPLFINGRAGSGKSTVLQYLFKDLLFYYLTNGNSSEIAPPIYLTANAELLQRARDFVERLLKSHAVWLPGGTRDLVSSNRSLLDGAFREFQPHLLSLVPQKDREQRFARGLRVDYPRFRRMWSARFGRDKRACEFGPDVCWHVIRTYIKGMSSEVYLEADDYAHLPENQLTVTKETFQYVYEKVWEGWYERELSTKRLWDDQDLTRYVLDNDLAEPKHPAVFCDEAQDFTRLELELLLRLNLFSNRTLPPNDICRVPFAFAGDQFQTLNPTGFRWDAIKASFVEKFIGALDPAGRTGRTDLNYKELKYNYRSTQKIVRFGNLVQALRSSVIRVTDLRPQRPWTTETNSVPVSWFRDTHTEFWNRVSESGGFVVIVPCNEGEEEEYVLGDPILRNHIRIEDGVPRNVLSAASSKGCEYPAVIVYGFGGVVRQFDINSELSTTQSSLENPDHAIPLQYFFNKLYVAVSRPKQRLIIADSDAGVRGLWLVAQDEDDRSLMLRRIKNGEQIWGSEIEGMTLGRLEDLTKETVGDPLEIARAHETEGRARQSGFLLMQAAQAYKDAGAVPKSRECKARALEADGRLVEAGEAFTAAGFLIPDAVRSFWGAGIEGWRRLASETAPQIKQEIEYVLASAAFGKLSAAEIASAVKRFAQRLWEDPEFAEGCLSDPNWTNALDAVLTNFLTAYDGKSSYESYSILAGSLDRIRKRAVKIPAKSGGGVYFLARRYPESVELWNLSGDTSSKDYLTASASIEPYPQRIIALVKLGHFREVVSDYLKSPGTNLTREQSQALGRALVLDGQGEEAISLAFKAFKRADDSTAMGIALAAIQQDDRKTAIFALHLGLRLLVENGRWETLADLGPQLTSFSGPEWQDPKVKRLIDSESGAIKATVVKALARSSKISSAPSALQRPISDFLRGYLRVRGGEWKLLIRVEEAGAAIERGGRIVDAISFYEAILKDNTEEKWKVWASTRWVKCKRRQLETRRSAATPNKVRVREIEREINQMLAQLKLSNLDEIPEYPALPSEPAQPASPGPMAPKHPESSPVAPPEGLKEARPVDPLVVVVGPFKMEISRKHMRCNITNTESMQTAYALLAEDRCGGEVAFSKATDSHWECREWEIRLTAPKGGAPMVAVFASLGCTLEIPF